MTLGSFLFLICASHSLLPRCRASATTSVLMASYSHPIAAPILSVDWQSWVADFLCACRDLTAFHTCLVKGSFWTILSMSFPAEETPDDSPLPKRYNPNSLLPSSFLILLFLPLSGGGGMLQYQIQGLWPPPLGCPYFLCIIIDLSPSQDEGAFHNEFWK